MVSSQMSDSPGTGPARTRFPFWSKTARLGELSCTTPPQIGFDFDRQEEQRQSTKVGTLRAERKGRPLKVLSPTGWSPTGAFPHGLVS